MWAAAQATRCTALATEDELSDEDSVEDGVLGATEKEELRTLSLDKVLDECDRPTVGMGAQVQRKTLRMIWTQVRTTRPSVL